MSVGLILIGDELLNGSRSDKHMPQVIKMLKKRGLQLNWVRMVGDERSLLIDTFRQTFATPEIVFSFGGIGATPDDLTRECAAEAAGLPVILHPEAKQLIEDRFGESAYPNRILMAQLAEGSKIIPNPVNQVPGFSIHDHHFVPGFPDMAWPMVEWVLETYYSLLFGIEEEAEIRWEIRNKPESELLETMRTLLELFPEIKLSSLPSTTNKKVIDFGIKGKPEGLSAAAEWMEAQFLEQDVENVRKSS